MKAKTISNNLDNTSLLLTCTKLTLFTVAAVAIQLIGLSLFITGFFPVKPTLSGMSGPESFYPPGTDLPQNFSSLPPPEKLKSFYQELSGVPPLYDRLILMVIDGLPAEFVLGKPPSKVLTAAMPYTQSLLAQGFAIGYHSKAAPPTVTMPRLKAMVSGAIGGFLDVATNFNTQAFLEDNLIGQFFRAGWKMVMLGDETWLKLFPEMFSRHDGVSSFFVKDTVQVDYNVSRHLPYELNRTDWDLLILHYLGVDHVGHIGGRSSILMGPKLREMDEVIEKIHSSILDSQEAKERTLLMIVSDHGMTDGGNHGGSSYEETDSLALFVGAEKFSDAAETYEAHQVDIAVTLALLFGVPIPKNSVGTVMPEVFTSLADEKKLRILQLNSWQLLQLLQTHLTELGCGRFSCVAASSRNDVAEKFCCSYLNATALHKSWESKKASSSSHEDDYTIAALAYHGFLQTASLWLSSRATDKPTGLLACGIAAMLVSCLGLMSLLFYFSREVYFKGKQYLSYADGMQKWCLEDSFIPAVIFILIYSMGSSSMIEEEQYIWNFVTSSLYLMLLRKGMQSFTKGMLQPSITLIHERKIRSYHNLYYIIAALISGRILRGWHQGGVNWCYLPDISKFLLGVGCRFIKPLHLLSLVLVVVICFTILLLRFRIRTGMIFVLVYLLPVLLILKQILQSQDSTFISSDAGATTRIQIIYAFLGSFTLGILFATPWLMPLKNPENIRDAIKFSSGVSFELQSKFLLGGFRDSIYVIGWGYIFSWCLLQLLLQQPTNATPISLLLVQILASIRCFSDGDLHLKQWVKVAALYYVGMAGHYGLGNTNTLATIDVAGAFIGISSHSTLISGILMFIITYASPMLALISTLMDASNNDLSIFTNAQDVDFLHLLKMTIGYPCLVPLVLNSILLLAYTIMLLLMQNHLFVWSVFSPKYLYVCATTACVYIGVSIVALTAAYNCMVFATRTS